MNDIESNLLKGLNEQQVKAVTAPDGPLLILAGAGSGKTKTLTHRIAYLMAVRGVPSSSILAVTFTNKAAEEMKQRIVRLLAQISGATQNSAQSDNAQINNTQTDNTQANIALPMMGTFHSVCMRFLRKDIVHLGRERNFVIIDAQDQTSMVKAIMKQLQLDPKQFAPRSIVSAISRAKNNLLDASAFADAAGSYYEQIVAQIYDKYEQTLREINVLDFDDLIVLTVQLFQKHPEVLERYQDQFRHILVDEYQDTNHMQYQLVSMLAAKNRNLFIIGDDYQSIYAFRAADITNILEFGKQYTDATMITLEQNYRSTQVILDAATAVIAKNKNQHHKKLWTEKSGGAQIVIHTAQSERDEMGFVARQITACHHGNGGDGIKHNYSDMVVLYRTNAQSRVVEEALMEHSIPYRIVGGTKFYDRKEIKDVLSYLKLVYNFANNLALERIVNVPTRGIGPKTLGAWQTYAVINGQNMIDAGLALRSCDKVQGLSQSKRVAIADFCEFIAKTGDKMPELGLAEFIEYIYQGSGYKAMLTSGENSIENEARDENIKELLSVAVKYKGVAQSAIEEFLESVALVSDTDKIDQDVDAVHLMTLHSVKGLEFPVVFMVGLEEGLIPHARSQLATNELEEERRLMYVGMTRAKDKLYLSHAHHRMIFGSLQSNAPSRFLIDVPDELCQRQGGCDSKHASGGNNTFDEYDNFDDDYLSNSSGATHSSSHSSSYLAQNQSTQIAQNQVSEQVAPTTFRDGTSVKHEQFGTGLIVAQSDTSYTVAFANTGIKQIAKNFQGLTNG